ncbi:MAG: PAS domain-containing sensor histidine kinase [Promethearchaeota archaeon]|nr:MAG: PAS domain-containing sensor histidine kinase [Candidatus Lokiarchaeota archaeon]
MLSIIKENSNSLEEIFENSFDYIYLHDKKGNIIDVNNIIVENLGYSKQELLNMKVTDFLVEEVKSDIINDIKKTIETGIADEPSTYKMRKKDGSFIFIEVSAIPLKKDDKFYAVLGIGHDITAYIKVEQKLKESEEYYRLITENANDLIRVLNERFEIEFVNETAHFKILGYPKEELIGKPAIFLNHPEDYTTIRRFLRKIFKSGEGTHESRVRHSNGQWIWFEIKVKMFENEKGKTKYLFVSREITERKKAEQELRESEEKFRVITEQSFMSIMVIQDGILKYFNERLPKRLGYSREEINNWAPNEFAKVIHPDYRDFVLEQARKKQEGKEDVINNYIYRSVRKDGSHGWVENFSKTINYGGRSADLVMSIDISEKLDAEQKLKESEEKFRNIAEQSFMGVIIIQDGQVKYMNKALSKISGYSIEELTNLSQKDMLKMIHPEDLDLLLKRLQSNIDNTMGEFSNNFFRIINRTGEVRWLEDYTRKIIYEEKPANLISIVDITDKKKAEQLIIEENKRLQELHELRKDIITRVSHELKTPMTSIYGATQILIKLYMDDIGKEAQKYIEIGHRGSLRMKQLIDNLLDVSRLDAKRFELLFQKENLIELIIDCVNDMKYLASNRQLKLKLDLPNESHLNIDRLRFRQVLTNIISNAIKNTQKNGEIFINLVEETEYVDIHIKDTGVGFTKKEIVKLFEKFGKIERYGMDLGVDIEGSGLGLFISKEIVELHGGKILVESEGRNKGSIFTIRLFKNK